MGMNDCLQVYYLRIQTSHPSQLSLAIPQWVGKMSNGNGYGHRWERNGEFCLTLSPVTRTAGILTQLVKDAGC